MRIKIESICCDDLPSHYFQDSWYQPGKILDNFYVGCERDVYAISLSNIHFYWIRLDEDTPYLNAFPAALTSILNHEIPSSWIVAHETKILHRKLPDHQVVFCPKSWVAPYFSIFVERLAEGESRETKLFLETAQHDYPNEGS